MPQTEGAVPAPEGARRWDALLLAKLLRENPPRRGPRHRAPGPNDSTLRYYRPKHREPGAPE